MSGPKRFAMLFLARKHSTNLCSVRSRQSATDSTTVNRTTPHGCTKVRRCRMLSAGLLDKNPRSAPSCSSHQAISKTDLAVRTLSTLIWRSTLLLAAFGSAGCSVRTAGSAELQSLTPASAAAIDESARTFMHTVAHDVTQEGPLAWLKFFNTGPEFFMAVNGQLAFPNAAAAKEGTQNFARTINRIDLTWGDDFRVDPLTAELAVVAASWREIQLDKAWHRIEEAGYFTGRAGDRHGRCRLLDPHRSALNTPPPPRSPP